VYKHPVGKGAARPIALADGSLPEEISAAWIAGLTLLAIHAT
jgi:hypothetical protein